MRSYNVHIGDFGFTIPLELMLPDPLSVQALKVRIKRPDGVVNERTLDTTNRNEQGVYFYPVSVEDFSIPGLATLQAVDVTPGRQRSFDAVTIEVLRNQ